MDHGPLLAQKEIPLMGDETVSSLTEKVVTLGVPLLCETLKSYNEGAISPIEQNHDLATYCKILTREDGKMNLSDNPATLDRKIRAYNPWPGTWTMVTHDGKPLRVKILKAKLIEGKLEILEVQPEGKKAMSINDFLRGYGPILDFPLR
jgi:methionyl-tRNA formyltransferase